MRFKGSSPFVLYGCMCAHLFVVVDVSRMKQLPRRFCFLGNLHTITERLQVKDGRCCTAAEEDVLSFCSEREKSAVCVCFFFASAQVGRVEYDAARDCAEVNAWTCLARTVEEASHRRRNSQGGSGGGGDSAALLYEKQYHDSAGGEELELTLMRCGPVCSLLPWVVCAWESTPLR